MLLRRRAVRIRVVMFVMALLCPACAWAQPATVDDFRTLASKITTESKIFPLMRDATNEARQASPEPSLALLASNDGTTAKARFGYLVADIASLEALISGPV